MMKLYYIERDDLLDEMHSYEVLTFGDTFSIPCKKYHTLPFCRAFIIPTAFKRRALISMRDSITFWISFHVYNTLKLSEFEMPRVFRLRSEPGLIGISMELIEYENIQVYVRENENTHDAEIHCDSAVIIRNSDGEKFNLWDLSFGVDVSTPKKIYYVTERL